MGFLRRLLGQPSLAPGEVGLQVTQVTFEHVRGEASVEVVGEQYYPSNVEAFRHYSSGRPQQAVLMPDPTNEHDTNAIVVLAAIAPGPPPKVAKVGHLLATDAAAYRPVFDYLQGKVIVCEAAIAPYRGGRGAHGVVLHLGTPGELIAEMWADDHPIAAAHPWRGQTVVFTGFGLSLAGVTLDREGQALLARLAGCIVAPRVTKATNCVVNDPSEETGATAKARQYGIPVVGESEFWASIGISSTDLGRGLGRWAQPRERSWR